MAKCWSPITKRFGKAMTYEIVDIPCGKCVACKKARTSAWSLRLRMHERAATNAYFLTLTYNTTHIPITPKGFMSLEPEHLTLYLKRLRKAHKKQDPQATKITYYAVGEYGTKSWRPHYHLIIFNVDIKLLESCWSHPVTKQPYGEIHIGTVTGASIGYTLKYLAKPKRVPTHRNDDRITEFARMSKGIGLAYLTPQMIEYHQNDPVNRVFATLDDKKVSLPRYFKNRIYDGETWNLIKSHFQQVEAEKPELTEMELHDVRSSHLATQNNYLKQAQKGEKL